jgi:hypothetical protein
MPDALAAAILRLVGSPELLHAMGKAGRQRLLDGFTYRHMARGFADAYRQVLQATNVSHKDSVSARQWQQKEGQANQ